MQTQRRPQLPAAFTANLPVGDCRGNKNSIGENYQSEIIFYPCGVEPVPANAPLLVIAPGDLDQAGLNMAYDQQSIAVNTSASLAAVANNRGSLAISFTGNLQNKPLSKILSEMNTGLTATPVPGDDSMLELLHGDQGGSAKPTFGMMVHVFLVKNGTRETSNLYWCPATEVMFAASRTFGVSQTPTNTPFTFSLMPFDENNNRMIERFRAN